MRMVVLVVLVRLAQNVGHVGVGDSHGNSEHNLDKIKTKH